MLSAFNRTIVELKRVGCIECHGQKATFNRTIVELKLVLQWRGSIRRYF